MYRPSQTPHLNLSSAKIKHKGWILNHELHKEALASIFSKSQLNGVSETTSKVEVFQDCASAPSYATPSGLLHKFRLESNSTGSSFPEDAPKPAHMAVVSLDSR